MRSCSSFIHHITELQCTCQHRLFSGQQLTRVRLKGICRGIAIVQGHEQLEAYQLHLV